MVATNVLTGGIASTKKQDIMVLALITSIVGSIAALIMYVVLSSEVIMGWDTPAYIYLTRVLAEFGLQRYLELTSYGGNGLLYYFLLYASYVATGTSLFVLDKVLSSILFAGILMSVPIITFKWTGNPHLALLSLPFAIGWPAPYILASNLHSNLLGFLFILLALAFLPDGLFSSSRSYLAVVVLMLLASLSHPQSTVYFGFIIAAGSSLSMFVSAHRKALFLKVMFLLFVSTTQVILSIILSGQSLILGPLLNPILAQQGGLITISIAWGFQLISYMMLPVVILSVYIVLNKILRLYKVPSRQKESMIYLTLLMWTVSTFVLWFLSYPLPLLSTYAERLLTIFPSPLLLTIGFAKIWDDLCR